MPEPTFDRAAASESWSSEMVRDWLRKPFKPEQIGKLPATAKRPALDFVGHAAVTDRLNKIAPDWSYTVDNMSTIGDAIWIRGTMTIGGISRPEFGDGKDPKEAIGNFLRRGAMRFGVAIDLWSREELESAPAMEASADAGGRVDQASSASRESSGERTQDPSPVQPSVAPAGSPESSEGTAESLGEGGSEPSATPAPGGGSSPFSPSPGKGTAFPLKPEDCDHKTKTGRWLPARQLGGVPVCPRCGASAVLYRESA